MADSSQNDTSDSKPMSNGHAAKHEDLFEEVGKKVEGMNLNDTTDKEHNENGDDGSGLVDEIESYCVNCGENGTTRLLLTKIPYFREIVLMSFHCQHCHFKNSEIQSAGEIQERGSKYTLRLDCMDDFERQVVKSDTAIFRVEDPEIEIPAGRGQLTNVEGILAMILKDLEADQPRRKRQEPELFEKIDTVVQALIKKMLGTRFPFKITLDDPAGNAWIEPSPEDKDGKYIHMDYARTVEQNAALGLGDGENLAEAAPVQAQGVVGGQVLSKDEELDVNFIDGEPMVFDTACPGCTKPCQVRMQMVDIPHFKQVVIISTACDHCAYRTSEVKTGGAVPENGRQIILKVLEQVDLARDVLKSESCTLSCPELKLEVTPGTMSGRFTTVEGLLTQVYDTLYSKVFEAGGAGGDSMDPERKQAWDNLFKNLQAAIKGEFKYQIVLTDPLAGSYIQNLCTPDDDPQLAITDYERSEEENEELGLTDMRTEMDEGGTYRKPAVGEAPVPLETLVDGEGSKHATAGNAGVDKTISDNRILEHGLALSEVKAKAVPEGTEQSKLGSNGVLDREEDSKPLAMNRDDVTPASAPSLPLDTVIHAVFGD